MPKKRRTKTMPATLLALHDKCLPGTSTQSDVHDEELVRKVCDPFLAIKELEEKIEKNYELSKEKELGAPPLLHICVQYCEEVVQSRYEQSIFSSIIHEADNIVDKVTGDEDDSDFESLLEVEDCSSVFDGLGITQSKGVPELRILIIKITNVNKICDGKIDDAKAVVTYQSGKKTSVEKTKRKQPNYRHTISFNHVFIFRGASIEQLRNADIKLSLKTYSSRSNEEAFVILSNARCVMEDRVHPCSADDIVTNPLFWKEYMDKRSQELVRFTVPLVCPNRPHMPKRRGPLPPSISSTPTPPPEATESSKDRDSSSSSDSGEELAALRSESPIVAIVIDQTEESEPNVTNSPAPEDPISPKSRSSSPTKREKPRSRRSSSDSASSRSDQNKKKKFRIGKFTKLFTQ